MTGSGVAVQAKGTGIGQDQGSYSGDGGSVGGTWMGGKNETREGAGMYRFSLSPCKLSRYIYCEKSFSQSQGV